MIHPAAIWRGFRLWLTHRDCTTRLAERFAASALAPAVESEFPLLDRASLERYVSAFEELGFRWVADMSSRAAPNVTGFMRLMVHDAERSWVSIGQVFPAPGKAEPLKCAIISPFEDGWSLSSNDHAGNPILMQLRLPRQPSLRDCDATPEQLWHEHLRRRQAIMNDLNLQPLDDLSGEAFVRWSRAAMQERSQLAMQKNALLFLIRMESFKISPPPRRDEWPGDWKPRKET